MRLNAASKERYYFEEEVDRDFSITEGRQTLSGTMAATDAQWRCSLHEICVVNARVHDAANMQIVV